jgi:hypothetical protein
MNRPRVTLLAALAAAGLLGAAAIGVAAQEPIVIDAATTTIAVDGDPSDWADIAPTTVSLEQIRLADLDPADAEEIEIGAVDPIDVQLRVANDADNIYVLLEVPASYDYNAEDLHLSPSVAVQFKIDEPASTHMGAEEADLLTSLGMVDIWHWELECGPGAISGGQGVAGGDDAACNFDDEYATAPERREDDGGGDVENTAAENALVGSWNHTGAEAGADGTWIFEMSRPLQTGDPQDAQLEAGSTAPLALAWFDPSESAEGWSDAGHLTSSYGGWIEVNLN